MDKEIEKLLNTSFKISLDEAAHLILAFLREPSLLLLASEAIGGTIRKKAITQKAFNKYRGSMGWYCRDESGRFPKLFMAFEDAEYVVGKVPTEPSSETLLYPGSTFTYPGKNIDEDSVVNMLKTHQMPLAENIEISKSEVINLVNKFPADSDGNPYNKFPCSFFENRGIVNRDMEEFLRHSSLVAVRYYFGFDTSYSHKKSNRIRVIFVGVDSNGKNIIGSDSITTITSRFVQNSWPPPPPPNSIY